MAKKARKSKTAKKSTRKTGDDAPAAPAKVKMSKYVSRVTITAHGAVSKRDVRAVVQAALDRASDTFPGYGIVSMKASLVDIS